jgi:hypothetical protein
LQNRFSLAINLFGVVHPSLGERTLPPLAVNTSSFLFSIDVSDVAVMPANLTFPLHKQCIIVGVFPSDIRASTGWRGLLEHPAELSF